jgi:mannose-1-phosphate guanylyltransferase / mannose-6-phosphate isomerase
MSILIPVILSGGAGSRLWPVSREGHPKPFMKLADGQTLLEKTYRRAASLQNVYSENGLVKLLTVTNRDYYFMSRDELDKANAKGTFLLEPFGRNTAPAIALAAYQIQEKFGSEAMILVLAADHLISDDEAFEKAVKHATELARKPNNFMVTFGIVPSSPDTGFGYIETAEKIANGFKVKDFVEKPNYETAKTYLQAGNYFWNSGMFCFTAENFLKQLNLYSPDVAKSTLACWNEMNKDSIKSSSMLEIPETHFQNVPNISVDYAVMEKSSEVAVVPGNFGWSDIGSWGAIRNLINPDEDNNRVSGDAIFVNTFVQSEDRIVATVGVENLMIIDTKDALLVTNAEQSQEVKKVVNILKQKNHGSYKLHNTVSRPWGTYTVLEDHPGFKIKRIEVRPGGKLSLQMHHHRSEHWIVVKGEAYVVNGEKDLTIFANQSTYIAAGKKHRLENRTVEDLVLIEVQCGPYLGEDDIIRFEDTYGRV